MKQPHGEESVGKQRFVRATQRQERRPYTLYQDRKRGRAEARVNFLELAEKQPITGLREVDPRARQDRAVSSAGARKHDGEGDDGGANRSHGLLGEGGSDMLGGRDLAERHDAHIRHIREQVEQDHGTGSDGERKWNVALRLAHFSSDERNVLPPVIGQETTEHREYQTVNGERGCRHTRHRHRRCSVYERAPDEHCQPGHFQPGEHVLGARTRADAPVIDEREQCDHPHWRPIGHAGNMRQKVRQIDAEAHRDRGNRAGLRDQKRDPAGYECRQPAVGFAQVDILSP